MLAPALTLFLLLQGEPVLQETVPQDPAESVRLVDDRIHVTFDHAKPMSLHEWVQFGQRITGKTYLVDPTNSAALQELEKTGLVGYGEKVVAAEDFDSFFQNVLKVHGVVLVQRGSGALAFDVITKLNAVTVTDIKANTLFVSKEEVPQYADQPATYVTTVVRLRYADAQNLGTSLRTALSGGGIGSGQDSFMPLPSENALLVQGFGPFVAASVGLIGRLDAEPLVMDGRGGPISEFRIYQLKHRDATELREPVSEFLGRVNQSQPQGRARRGGAQEKDVVAVVEPRTNALLISATPQQWAQLEPLLQSLDRPVEEEPAENADED